MREAVLNSSSLVKIYPLSMLLAIICGMLLVVQAKSLFFVVGFFILLAMLIYLLDNPIKGIILFLSTKCIFDMFWFIKLPVGELFDLNIQKVLGVVFPIMILGIFALKKKKSFITLRTTLGKLILLYVAFNLLAIVLAESTSRALVVFSKMTGSYILFFVFGVAFFTERDLRKLCHYFLVFLWIPLGIAFLEKFGLVSFSSFIQNTGFIFSSAGEVYATRLVGLYSHPFDLVRYLVVAFPLSLWMYSTEKNLARRYFYLSNLFLLGFAMWHTFYRTGWIIMALQLILWPSMRKKYRSAFLLAVILLCVILINSGFFASFYDTLLVLFHPQSGDLLTAFSGRFVIWNFHLAKFVQSPLQSQLFGHGLASDVNIYYEMSDVLAPTRQSNHSDFIRNLGDTGILGLGVYVLMLAFLIKELWSEARRTQHPSFKGFAQAVILIFLGFLLLSNVADPSLNPGIAWYLWGFAGIVIGRKLLNDKWKEQRGRT